jgi:tryptophan 7-halogenase
MPIEKIVIVGGGVAAWLAALALARKKTCTITVLDTGGIDDSLGVPLAVETTLPSISKLHELLGLDNEQVVRETGSSYALGRALSNWTATAGVAFHPFGEVGASLGPVGFQHLVARLWTEGQSVSFANHSLAALCAQSGRFAPPPADTRSVLSTMEYGLHLNVAEYRDYVKREATAIGVVTLPGSPADVILDDRGIIATLAIDTGEDIAGDLFLDCSGQARLLSSQMPQSGFQSWSEYLPCNHVRTSASPFGASPPLYAHIDAHENGWQRFTSTQTLLEEVVASQTAAPEGYIFNSGRIEKPWVGNCVAIGGAAAIVDPLASTQLHLVGRAIARLLKLFPHECSAPVEAAEYNRQTIEELENARDFAILHYKCNGRTGDAFWNECRVMAVPERLAHKIALYESCGRIALHDEESFETWDWISVFDALGISPRSYDAMANGIPMDRIQAHLAQVRNVMLKALGSLPTQQEYLQSCKAAA